MAAAFALAAALRRRRSAVITVDPARRLKDALGLPALTTEPLPVGVGDGVVLDAMALDTKRTFDAIVRRFAPSPDTAERILHNRLYQQLSDELGGSAEYMAMEKLHELMHHGRYQLVVVDTPPSSHARDLLAAPTRLGELLATRAVTLLRAPASLLTAAGSGVGRLGMAALLKVLERWTGLTLLQELSHFVSGFDSMIAGFRARAEEVERLLHSTSTTFVLVTTPEADAVARAIDLHRELRQAGFHIAGLVANRVMAFPRLESLAIEDGRFSPLLQRKLTANYADLNALSRRDMRSIGELHRATALPLLAAIPMLSDPPVSLAELRRLADYLAP
jgi:anion-transporting  ArsA/GET3 family ATPase